MNIQGDTYPSEFMNRADSALSEQTFDFLWGWGILKDISNFSFLPFIVILSNLSINKLYSWMFLGIRDSDSKEESGIKSRRLITM